MIEQLSKAWIEYTEYRVKQYQRDLNSSLEMNKYYRELAEKLGASPHQVVAIQHSSKYEAPTFENFMNWLAAKEYSKNEH